MKLAPTGVGAEPKKIAIVVALIAAAGGIYWYQNRSDSPTVSASATPPPQPVPAMKPLPAKEAVPPSGNPINLPPRRTGGNPAIEDFRPSMKVKDDLDVSKIDPRIRLDLLAKVREAPMEGGTSSLFEFSKAPEPPTPKVEAIKPGPPPVPVPPPAPVASKAVKSTPGPPAPPPIPFKFYGYDKATDGRLQGYFLEGDAATTGEIFMAREGDTIKGHYKIVRIGIKSAVVEDTTTQNQQTLALLEEAQ